MMKIPFNKPFITGHEIKYIQKVLEDRRLSGDGLFTKKCHEWLEKKLGCQKVLLTHSCTGALEMAALLADIQQGDEIIMPSFTFVSTANAFVLRGGVPVFVDIRSDTLNIDEKIIEDAITPKTKAIVPVHYAGVGCEMETITSIAKRHHLLVIEDAAQAIMSQYNNQYLGTIGQMGCLSFHDTKNISSGEGGALLMNDERFVRRAEIIWQKGTNRKQFLRGEVDKYSWQDLGSSFLPGEMVAAFLYAQLDEAKKITDNRMCLWQRYHDAFLVLEQKGVLRRPMISARCVHNAHMYYLLLEDSRTRSDIMSHLKEMGINAVSHYVPLHSSPYGSKYARCFGTMMNTEHTSERILRLPLWAGLDPLIDQVINGVSGFFV